MSVGEANPKQKDLPMTVAELIEQLQTLPQDADVQIEHAEYGQDGDRYESHVGAHVAFEYRGKVIIAA